MYFRNNSLFAVHSSKVFRTMARSLHRPGTHGISQALLMLLLLLALPGCSSMQDTFSFLPFVDSGDEEMTIPDQQAAANLLAEGMEAYNVGDYYEALQAFNQILDQYPFSPQAVIAELRAADCHYYRKEYLEAKTLYQEFEERHPTHPAIPYVMFQVGMCDFKRVDRIDRDITGAQDAIRNFSKLLRSYPDSPYSEEARAHIAAAREFLVNHEYFVAVFYVRTEKYDQAIHRLKYLLRMYPDSAIAPRAKALLARLEAGEPPKWGLRRWLPDLKMPDLKFWGEEEPAAAKQKP
jgi:outer membrane protein assembly factor BamD